MSECSKKRYDKAMAKQVARLDREATGEFIEPYQCKKCTWWHVGHANPKQQLNKKFKKRYFGR
jgi:hypothetical protein